MDKTLKPLQIPNIMDLCSTCSKDTHCCIFNNSGFTFVGLEDAKKIRKAVRKDYSYFLDYSPLRKSIVKILKDSDPALEGALRYSQLDKDRILRLKTKTDGRCIFFSGKCEIYEVRPNICRIYPYWAMRLDSGDIKIVMHDEVPVCPVIKARGAEIRISEEEKLAIRKTFRIIEREDLSYKKNIKDFVDSL
jgi:Fe-S-cluster containining protein